MSETKHVVPQPIKDAVHNALASYPVAANTGHAAEIACDAFAKALRENPIVPTDEQAVEMMRSTSHRGCEGWADWEWVLLGAIQWQRRMFLAPEPEVDPLVMYIERHFEDSSTDKLLIRNCAEAAAQDYHEHVKRNSPEPQDGPRRAGFNGEPVASNLEFTNALKAVQGDAPEPEVSRCEVDESMLDYVNNHSDAATYLDDGALVEIISAAEAYLRGQQEKKS
jgi:hypothetical protein